MKLTKKSEKQLMALHEAYWAEYLLGNVEALAAILDESYTQVGSAESEVFYTKKEAVQFLYDTIEEVAGKLEMRNRKTRLESQNGLVLVHELCDLYALDGKEWIFYSKFRASTLFQERKEGWKITHQHSSFPDSKTDEGRNVAIDKIAEENKELREAVKRRTKELEDKNRELEIEVSLERIRARAIAMRQSEELSDVLAVLFQQFDVLGIRPVNVWLSLYNKEEGTFTYRATGTSGKRIHKHQVIDLDAMDIWKESVEQWENGTADEVIVTHYPLDIFPQLMEVFKETFMAMPEEERIHPKDFPDGGYNVQGYCKFGYIGFNHKIPPTEEEKDILKKFATEFERMYQRFLEIQKAESQAREAQIESALERIRARAMAMHSSEELHDVLCVLFQQFDVLGIKPISAFLSLFSSEERVLTYRATGTSGARTQGSQTVAIDSLEVWKEIYDKWKTDTSEAVEVIFYPKEILPKLFELFEETFSSMPADERMTADHFPEGGYTMHGHTRFGYIGYNHTRLPTEEEKEILTKFATEFERVYQRFLDIEKAEAQARQAQIEAALERVRTRTMAMHNTDDIAATVTTFFNEIMGLGLGKTTRSGIGILSQSEKMELWTASVKDTSEVVLHAGLLDMTLHPLLQGVKKAWQAGDPHFTYELSGKDKLTYFRAINKAPEYPIKIDLKKLPEIVYHYSFPFRDGSLFVFAEEHLWDQIQDIFKRFAAVFGQTYTRYLDLHKAEAQAREAKIESALEKVRSQSLAMHTTSEMQQVANAVYDQLRELGLEMDVVAMSGVIEVKEDYDVWIGGAPMGKALRIPYNEDTKVQRDYNRMLEERPELFAKTYSGKEKKEYIDRLLTHGEFPPTLRKKMETSDAFTTLVAPKKNSGIQVVHYSDQPFTVQNAEILKRFAGVFEQAYIRFMDLEKAEEQAREAQIEAALEKVRSRTMAMHKSQELGEVASVMFEQISMLTKTPDRFNIGITNEEDATIDIWVTDQNGREVNQVFVARADKSPIISLIFEQKKTKKYLALDLHGKALQEWVQYMNKEVGIPFKKEQLKEHRYINSVFFSHGFIGVTTNEPLAEATGVLIGRFAKVFQQTYVRFLDLQKAEAQAREANIQLALERVRAKAMAMRQSEELTEVLPIIFEQLDGLGVKTVWTHLTLIDLEKNTFTYRMTGREGKRVFAEQVVDMDASDIWKNAVETFKSEKPNSIVSFYFPPESLAGIWEIFDGIFSTLSEGYKIHPEDFPGGVYTTQANCEFGYIGINNAEKATKEEEDILLRFAKEFGRLYRRFLDLQKAETQARENQIQLSLERVRARSMAMHSSEELTEVLTVLFAQFDILGIHPRFAHLTLFDEERDRFSIRITGSEGQRVLVEQFIDMDALPAWKEAYLQWKVAEPNTINCIHYTPEVLPQAFDLLKDIFAALPKGSKMKVEDFPNGAYTVQGHFNYGYLGYNDDKEATEEQKDIVVRFATEFGRVYQRFLDLQRSEAQARESQIEAALEKVRSRSLAMQKPEELQQVVAVVAEELKKLSVVLDVGGVVLCTYFTDSKDVIHWTASDDPKHPSVPFFLPYFEDTLFDEAWASKLRGDTYFAKDFPFEVKNTWFEKAFEISDYGNLTDDYKNQLLNSKSHALAFAWAENSAIMVPSLEGNLPSEAEKEILIRFAKVFEQAYIRFMDLEKAEVQARESRIEAALEKVRSRSLAMQRSEELQDVVQVVAEKLTELDVVLEIGGIAICTYFENSKDVMHWTASNNPLMPSKPYYIEYYDTPMNNDAWAAKLNGDTFFEKVYSAEDCKHYFDNALENTAYKNLPEGYKELLRNTQQHGLTFALQKNSTLMVPSLEGKLLKEEEKAILIRFSKVFEQAYIRFMDLQKAEAQARESKIEMALEKVRSRTMAMHKSEELGEVAAVLFEQISTLTYAPERFNIAIGNKEEESFDIWVTDQKGHKVSKRFMFQVDKSPVVREVFNAWEKEPYIVQDLHGKKLQEWVRYMQEEIGLPFDEARLSEHRYINSVFFSHGCIGITTNEPPKGDTLELIERFAKVFQQTYVRFLDLQKAEAQAREAQIEVALERVRSRAMAMHHTDELTDVLGVLFNQFDFLGINPVLTHLTLFDEYNETFTLRLTTGGEKRTIAEQLIDVNAVESWKTSFANWKKSELHAVDCIDYPPEVLPAVWEVLDGVMSALPEGQKLFPEDFPDGLYTTQGHCKYGYIGFNHTRRATEEEKEIVVRFAKEFGRLYQRFLDIKNAETQAREAQIEGALERVRSRTMAMHNSKDLEEIVISLFDEVLKLGLDKSIRCGIGILEGHEGMETRSVNSNSDGTIELRVGMLNMTIHPMLVGLKKAWKNGRKGYSYEFKKNDVRKYYTALNNEPEYPFNADLKSLPNQEYHRSFFFSSGIIFAFSQNPISEESSKILARFATVFGQTYRRYLDLQKAEERAKDAVKQASLDRVRGQISGMRSTQDLERITPLVWNELTTLGIPFIRCGVFIIDKADNSVQAFLSTPDGRSLGAMRIPVHADKDTAATVAHWKRGEVYRTHWDKKQFLEFMQTMTDLGQVKNQKEYQGAEQPPESLYLHFVPFTQGMMYVGNVEPLGEDQIDLVHSLADAFAIAYARYEDFSKLEKAKERVETTLSELKATQNQLVQSEKMASLGELTAGIAHEIQNPLNFVNNFSEVSVELIEEMLEEIKKGDVEEVKALADDIIQNLQKINHHGKRADGIVKGMLQHSRASSGEKEPTDLNVLADEYLRLAYHGLRAKDKSFNATLETHFDDSIGKVNVMVQDMGRVILNLITNAFYVVQKKKEEQPDGFEPTVTVTTHKEGNKVKITIKDNGNGIPEAIKEKIFQPFFTTKPTGQGTGLGLSMSYDIITKGHGGELEVNTKEGEWSVFTIIIPLT